eukprot:CAMPEP_0173274952 /NCGR_PEP_ID=MMETSP1143-20121109/2718_1 /TAXON_ID=483371 /ORGANISM="non described non described, Strain CCMP2298" /LENGTH=156 /DNA_ID=CAMNT_0014211805 /DNA_START=111 /DNA_END=578 /DNA_ORIENTATION=-
MAGEFDAEAWLSSNTNSHSLIPDDFGLVTIAEHFGKSEALARYWEGAAKEEGGDVAGAIALYKKAFRLWPALDSVTKGGLPSGVRAEAEAAGLPLLAVVDVAEARASRVIKAPGLLTSADLEAIERVRAGADSLNPENATHHCKTCTFLNNPPSFA